jgi:hypothetical protein
MTYGILARFETTPDIYHAAEKVRDAGFQQWDVISSFPIHGMNEAMGLKRSNVGLFTLLGGMTGFFTGYFIAWYMGKFDYPLIVGGKPYFDAWFPFPVAYELTILLAAFGTLFGMFFFNRLPRHHHPVMNYDKFADLMNDKFAVVIEASDPLFDETRTTEFLQKLGATETVILPE